MVSFVAVSYVSGSNFSLYVHRRPRIAGIKPTRNVHTVLAYGHYYTSAKVKPTKNLCNARAYR